MGRKSNEFGANKVHCTGCVLYIEAINECDTGLIPLTKRCTEEKEKARKAQIQKLQEIANG